MPAPQGKYFLLTLPHNTFTPYLPSGCSYIKGQLETGSDTGYLHWQVLVHFEKKATLAKVKSVFGTECHAELSRSEAANDYVWKEDTQVTGTQFQLGKLPFKRNSEKDWDQVLDNVKKGKFDEVPADVLIRCYGNLKKIYVDNLTPEPMEREVYLFWGSTGTGKSKRAWEEASWNAYPKDPNTKFWCGYQGQENVVIDEFRGLISISNMLRWLDRYPVLVEIKGSSQVFRSKRIWITSNLPIESWYPDLDQETLAALKRRVTNIIHFN